MFESAENENNNHSRCCCCKIFSRRRQQKLFDNQSKSNTHLTDNAPVSADLPKDLVTGKTICVTGIPIPDYSRFAVNLTCGKGPSADIAFHFNPRFAQRYIVRNSRLNGHWGEEETTSLVKFGFVYNEKFILNIFIAAEMFLVALNDVVLCTFQYRTPPSRITSINIEGAIQILAIDYKDLKIFPEIDNKTFVAVERRRGNRALKTLEEWKTLSPAMDMPCTVLLDKSFQQGWQLEIYGRVKLLPQSFSINLQEGVHLWPHPIIFLHLNPRFCTSGEQLLVRNAWIDGGWGQEERAPGFHFSPGSPFVLAIRKANDHFSIWVDGKLVAEFKFRITPDRIDAVHIRGDIVIYQAMMNENPTDRE